MTRPRGRAPKGERLVNPIEMMWRKVKAQARNHPDPLAAIAAVFPAGTPQDGLGWFAAWGYDSI